MSELKTRQQNGKNDVERSAQKNFQKQIHPWLCTILATTLGIHPGTKENPGILSTTMQLLTIGSSLSKSTCIYLIACNVFNRLRLANLQTCI